MEGYTTFIITRRLNTLDRSANGSGAVGLIEIIDSNGRWDRLVCESNDATLGQSKAKTSTAFD